MKRIKLIVVALMFSVTALLAQPEAEVINAETADEVMLFAELAISVMNSTAKEAVGYYQPVKAYSSFEIEEDNIYLSDTEILIPVDTATNLWGFGENNQQAFDPNNIDALCDYAIDIAPALNPKYRATKTRFEELLVKYAGTSLETPREERVKIVEEFWSKNYLKMKCKERFNYPQGGLLRQMAYGCFMSLFKMVEVWGYKFDFTFIEDDGMNIVDWINYATTTPSTKLLHLNDSIIEQKIPCIQLFKAKMIEYGVKPTGYNPAKQ
jgi:hypothetical protein